MNEFDRYMVLKLLEDTIYAEREGENVPNPLYVFDEDLIYERKSESSPSLERDEAEVKYVWYYIFKAFRVIKKRSDRNDATDYIRWIKNDIKNLSESNYKDLIKQ